MFPDSLTGYCPNYDFSLNNYYAGIAPEQPPTSCVPYDPLSFNGSIYGTGMDLTTDSALTGSLGSAGLGAYNMGTFGYNTDYMYDQMDKWTDYMFDRNAKYIEKGRANDMRINGPLESAQYAAGALREKIQKDDQPKVIESFENFKREVKKLYPQYKNLDDKALSAKAMELYEQRFGVSLKDDIRANSNNMFCQKFMNGLTGTTCFRGSAEETIAEISGNPVSKEDKTWGAVGRSIGFFGLGLAGFSTVKNIKKIGKFIGKHPWGAAIALLATAIGVITTKLDG